MKEPKIRKIVTNLEEVFYEGGAEKPVETNSGRKSIKTVSVAAVIKNPYAGQWVEDLSELTEYGEYLGISLHFKDAAFVRTHYGSFAVRIPDAPKSDEIVMAVVLADAGRPHALVNGVGRIGGLQKSEAKCEDGMH